MTGGAAATVTVGGREHVDIGRWVHQLTWRVLQVQEHGVRVLTALPEISYIGGTMVPITVLIRMTGLLLVTPSTQEGALPVHVLMPVARSTHLAQVGFRKDDGSNCDDWDEHLKICYRNMEGYVMELGPQLSGPSSTRVRLGGDFGNVTRASGVEIDRVFFGESPPRDRLRARITFRGGTQLPSCNIGRWTYAGSFWAPLANVATWEIRNAATDELVLTRRRFGSTRLDTLAVLQPTVGNSVELFIRHIPPDDARLDYFLTANSRTHNAMRGHQLYAAGLRATHFHSYYDLLGIDPAGSRPLPILTGQIGSNCVWARSPDLRITGQINPLAPGSPTCMVAGGTPP